jgi:hypothetical protein
MSLANRITALSDDNLIAEIQACLDGLDLTELPTPGLTPYLGTPVGDDNSKPEPCESCHHNLELNADFRCVRCGFQY